MRNGGIGLRTASTLATSAFLASAAFTEAFLASAAFTGAFLASAAFTEAFQKAILPPSHSNVDDETRKSAADALTSLSSSAPPELCFQRIQKAWDGPVIKSMVDRIALSANSDVDHVRLKAATALTLVTGSMRLP